VLVSQLETQDFEHVAAIIGSNPAETLVTAAQSDFLGVG
jgi:hypothetical protein